MEFPMTPTQRLTLTVATRLRMRCQPAHFLQLDSVVECLDDESARHIGKQRLADLYQRMKVDDGTPANS
jgi:hypothetical protein